MSFKRFYLDAADRQWPTMTDTQRANYLARKELDKNSPSPRWAVMFFGMLLLLIPLVYCVAANAAPVIVAPMGGGVVAAQRNNEPHLSTLWKDGPCRGQLRTQCHPASRVTVPVRSEAQ
ncbi:hypothetical protein [Pseudomonas benzopyrenica]|uniref:hypothetical protein n=1 Tax=Pseudomonas benzopyrenica TaxID=2993566 RepID=UPI00227D9D2E|nr:hypothetical protein [Pseudomonas benzopyrenica]MDC7832366.1 hypothetical protein [Pseudomonas benzopyrenica]